MPDLVPRAEPPPRLSPDRWWRWRRGPLRRPGDLLLAWAGLLLGLLAAAAAPLTGYLVGAAVYEGTTDSARARLEGGEHTTAVVLRHVPRHPEPGSRRSGRPATRPPCATPRPTGACAPRPPRSNRGSRPGSGYGCGPTRRARS